MFEDHCIIEKTTLGRSELKKRSELSRELRTVLILVDGKKQIQDYAKLIKGRQFLGEYASVIDCFHALLGLEMIAIVNSQGADNKEASSESGIGDTPADANPLTHLNAELNAPPLNSATTDSLTNSLVDEIESMALVNHEAANRDTPEASIFDFHDDVSSDTPIDERNILSSLVGIIEADLPDHAWEYVFDLESAANNEEIVVMIKKITLNHPSAFSRQSLETLQSIEKTLNGHFEKK